MGVSDGAANPQDQPIGKGPFPWNRVVAFLGPFLAIFSGAVATWLIEHVPGLHIDKATLASNITAGLVFLVGAAGTFAMHHKWLAGWQQWEQSITDVSKLAEPGLMPAGPYDPTQFAAPAPLPDDQPAPSTAGLGPTAEELMNGEPPLVDAGVAGLIDQGGQSPILPDSQEELASVADAVGDAPATARPETAVTPDEPADEVVDPIEV